MSGDTVDTARVFDALPVTCLLLDLEWRIVAVTDLYLQTTHTRRAEILGRGLFDVFPENPDDADASGEANVTESLRIVERTAAPHTMGVQQYDIRRSAADGGGFETRYWSPINAPVLDANGRVTHIVHRVEDVTEFVELRRSQADSESSQRLLRARAEEMEAEIYLRAMEIAATNRQLRAANEELARIAEERTRLHDALEAALHERSERFANVSHELRTPLTLIDGPVQQLLQDPATDDTQRHYLELISRNTGRLLSRVEGLLAAARFESGRTEPNYQRLHLTRMVRDTFERVAPLAAARGIEPQLDVTEPIVVEADPEQIDRVLSNVVSNALSFAPAGGVVRISVTCNETDASVEVADSGPGIPPAERRRVFEPFFQVAPQPRGRASTGLGLSLARQAIELHGGSIAIHDAPEGGALVRFRLPLRAPEGVTLGNGSGPASPTRRRAELPSTSANHASEPTPRDGRRTILVIEDDPELRDFLCGLFEPERCCIGAEDGPEGLELALEYRPDLVLTDVMLPSMDGANLALTLRDIDSLAETPILVLSGRVDPELRVALLEAGIEDVMAKPFHIPELRARVDNLLRRHRR